ncbi:MAG: hypothetical protein ACE1Z4_11780, partial [Gammaproteobacteria bacterium]
MAQKQRFLHSVVVDAHRQSDDQKVGEQEVDEEEVAVELVVTTSTSSRVNRDVEEIANEMSSSI